jgi:hypothetical protein
MIEEWQITRETLLPAPNGENQSNRRLRYHHKDCAKRTKTPCQHRDQVRLSASALMEPRAGRQADIGWFGAAQEDSLSIHQRAKAAHHVLSFDQACQKAHDVEDIERASALSLHSN